uniref:Pre-mRNA-splicing factor ISY1 homolog n=1 Tax=Junco hyemalis TaxID=40217 RepID=A0A8C5J268_JUNHY
MVRNAEKAMTALARFRRAQLKEGKVKEPFLASERNELPKAEKWRRQITGEISKEVAQIQNSGLGEFLIQDLNDEINKLLREKGHWEYKIKEQRGPDCPVLPSLFPPCVPVQRQQWRLWSLLTAGAGMAFGDLWS